MRSRSALRLLDLPGAQSYLHAVMPARKVPDCRRRSVYRGWKNGLSRRRRRGNRKCRPRDADDICRNASSRLMT